MNPLPPVTRTRTCLILPVGQTARPTQIGFARGSIGPALRPRTSSAQSGTCSGGWLSAPPRGFAVAAVLVICTNRNAIYKMMFDARRKLRAALVAKVYLGTNDARHVDG